MTTAANAALYEQLVKDHVPPALAELAGKDRLQHGIPKTYVLSIIASQLASRVVYREGLQFVESLSDEGLAGVARSYMSKEGEVDALIAAVKAAGLGDKGLQISALLEASGARAAVELEMAQGAIQLE